jgi:trehalose-6-phosphate synthase
MGEAMFEAMRLPKRDAKMRMSILRMQVRRHDVHDWAREFIEALRDA